MQIYGLVSKSWNVWFEDTADLNEFRSQHLTASTDPGVTVLDVIPKGSLTPRALDVCHECGSTELIEYPEDPRYLVCADCGTRK